MVVRWNHSHKFTEVEVIEIDIRFSQIFSAIYAASGVCQVSVCMHQHGQPSWPRVYCMYWDTQSELPYTLSAQLATLRKLTISMLLFSMFYTVPSDTLTIF